MNDETEVLLWKWSIPAGEGDEKWSMLCLSINVIWILNNNDDDNDDEIIMF